MLKSVGRVSSATFLSRILGLVREQVTAYLFGAGDMVDAFKSAFRIPNLLRDMFAEGALSAGFVPLFASKLKLQGKEDAFRFAGLVFGALTAVLAVIVLLMIAFTPQIATAIAGGFELIPGKLEKTILMGRVMMPFLLLISLSALLMGVLNSLGRFGIPALAPAILNLGMITSALVLSRYLQPPIMSLAIGVLIGGAGQFLLQYIALRKTGFRLQLIFDLFNPDLYRLLLLILPMTVGLAANQINVAVITRIASNETGAVSFLDYAFRLMHLPLGLFAVAIATVSLPRLAEEAAKTDQQAFSHIHSDALRLGLFLSIPAAMIMLLLGEEICAVIYQYGAFSRQDTIQTARALFMYSLGLPFFTMVRITVPAFYAMKNTRTPALISLVSVATNIILCIQFRELLGFAGLALAASVSGAVNITLLTILLRKQVKIAEDHQTLIAFFKIAAVTTFTGVALWIVRKIAYDTILDVGNNNFVALIIFLALTLALFISFCKLLRVEELTKLYQMTTNLLRRSNLKEG